jgi:hypothetical protein
MMRTIFHQIIDTAQRADHLTSAIDSLLRSTSKPLDPELASALHRIKVVSRDLALNAEEALVSLSSRLREILANA